MSDLDYIAKKCAKCKNVLPLSSFNKNKSKPDGLGTECRPCANAHSKKYHADNIEAHLNRGKANYRAKADEYKARAAKWKQENPERSKEIRANAYQVNIDKNRETSKADWAKHSAKRLARKKEYRKENPGICNSYTRKRYSRKCKALPAWADLDAIKRIYVECAETTRATGVKHHVDHYYPLKSDVVCGLHNEYNLQIITAAENQAKGNSFPG